MELLTEIRNLNSKLSGGESGSQSKKAIRLALDAIKPIYAGTQFAIQNQQNYIQKMMEDYLLVPKFLISGFSSYLCPLCFALESPVPIKDLGIDLTCHGRHHCKINSDELKNLTSVQKSRLASYMFLNLHNNVELWIPGKKLIVGNRIKISEGKDEDTIRKTYKKNMMFPISIILKKLIFNDHPGY